MLGPTGRHRIVPAVALLLPGLVLVGAIVAAAYALWLLPGMGVASPMILATLIAIAAGNFRPPDPSVEAGTKFSSRVLLRTAIVLLGLQLTVQDILAFGLPGLLAVIAIPTLTLLVALRLGRLLGVEARLGQLIAMGTAVCGASAIAATREVNRAGSEDVAYALIAVTLLGSVAMLVLPLVGPALGLDETGVAIWAGLSIHEIAQVAGATSSYEPQAAYTGMVAKLARVIMLAPLLLLAVRPASATGESTPSMPPVPGFMLAFLVVVGLNSLVPIPTELRIAAGSVSGLLMAMALAGLGLYADIGRLRRNGIRPLLLAVLTGLVIALLGLAAAVWLRAVG